MKFIKSALDDFEAGNRIFIGGSSDYIAKLDTDRLNGEIVIGINRWFRHASCKYWICADNTTRALRDFGRELPQLKAIRFMHLDTKPSWIRHDFIDFWFSSYREFEYFEKEWTGALYCDRSTAISAIHLAIILGAKEVILWGVDITGDTRFDGSYCVDWLRRFTYVDQAIQNLSKHIAIYKTNPDSPLNIPLYYEDFKRD